MNYAAELVQDGAQVMLLVPKSEWDAQSKRIERIENLLLLNYKKSRNEEWLTNKEVVEMLEVSNRTLQSWRDQRKIRFSQVGDIIRYKKTDIDEFLENHCIEDRGV